MASGLRLSTRKAIRFASALIAWLVIGLWELFSEGPLEA